MTQVTTLGPLSADADTYVHRYIDDRTLEAIEKGEYVVITGGRQTGKTSLLYRLRKELSGRGYASTYIDLSPLGEGPFDEERWYRNFDSAMRTTFWPTSVEPFRDPPTTTDSFRDYVLASCATAGRTLVIILDEVNAVPAVLRTPFFTLLRSIYNQRMDALAPKEANQLLFVFSGSFDPNRLIDSQNSPFNIARHLDTCEFDFSLDDVRNLADAFGTASLAESVFNWSAGHPYLTNCLLELASSSTTDEAVADMLRSDTNLSYVGFAIRSFEGTTSDLLATLLTSDKEVPYGWGISEALDSLLRIGLVKPHNGSAAIRCELYRKVIERVRSLQTESSSDAEKSSLLDFVSPGPLRDSAQLLLDVASDLAAQCPALSAVAVGSAVESILLLELERESDLNAAIDSVNEDVARNLLGDALKIRPGKRAPDDWSLAQMIEVARSHGMITKTSSQVSHGVREWRNFVHPAVIRKSLPEGVPSDVAESSIAVSATIIRELSEWRASHP